MTERPALTVVGTGIRCGTDLAPNARAALCAADDVFFITSDLLFSSVLLELRPDARSLNGLYGHDVERNVTYERMVERVLEPVRAGRRVCFAIPGHPGVFAQPTHESIRRARAEGYTAVMLPALSAADHLYADLGVDPGESGSLNFEATDFLVNARKVDPTAALILWQVGAIAEPCNPRGVNRRGLEVLTEVLLESYPASHEVAIYEAARYAICDPVVTWVRLDALPSGPVTLLSTLYVPAAVTPCVDEQRVERLGLMMVPA